MVKAFCLLNHELTQNQILELKNRFNVENIIYPPEELSRKWSQIPAEKELDKTIIGNVTNWLTAANKGDLLIVQGEFGATFMIVDYALKNDLVPLHAVTKRVAVEHRDGEVVSKQYVFEHVCFRKYEYYKI